jgi:D-alanyl-lipoteichoic acid acyltransferase DltB (MBOAT superfamily)
VFVTFLLSGLWHGANWTFVLWGAIHGFLRMMEDAAASLFRKRNFSIMPNKPKLKRVLDTVVIFAIVCFAWIFFRANTINDAFYIVSHLFSDVGNWISPTYLNMVRNDVGLRFLSVIVPVTLGIIMMLILWVTREHGHNPFESFNKRNVVLRWSFYIVLTLVIIFKFALSDTTAQFIYFQF